MVNRLVLLKVASALAYALALALFRAPLFALLALPYALSVFDFVRNRMIKAGLEAVSLTGALSYAALMVVLDALENPMLYASLAFAYLVYDDLKETLKGEKDVTK